MFSIEVADRHTAYTHARTQTHRVIDWQ